MRARYYPLLLLILGLVITSIWQQGVLFVLLVTILLWTNRKKYFTRKRRIAFFSILGFIALGTFPLLISQIEGESRIILQISHSWAITSDSLRLFLFIFLRCLNGYLSILLFTSLTPLYKLVIELRESRLPMVITELIEMIYRFVYILIEKAEQVLTAQKSRLGYLKYNQRLAHSGMLLSRTLVLAAQDSDTLYDSMLAKGLEEGEPEEERIISRPIVVEGEGVPLLKVDNLNFKYEENCRLILQNLNLEINKGERIALMGANGSGKSTLMRILSGLAKPQSGTLHLSGNQVDFSKKGMKQLRQSIGILFQNADLQLFCPTVWEEIAFGLRNLGYTGDELNTKVEQTLEDFGLKDVAEFPPHHLSGGQKRWVTLAAVDAMSPLVILLDEPFTGLDGYYIERLKQLLDCWSAQGKTLLISIHNSDFARQWCSRILLLDEKKIMIDDTPNAFFDHTDILSKAHISIPLNNLTQKGTADSQNFLPLFLPAKKIRGVIVGGGLGAYRKAVLLQKLGVSFDIISPDINPDLEALIQKDNRHTHLIKTYECGDLKSYTIAILATGDLEQEQVMMDECERYRVHYNCITDPALSTFQFGATGVDKGIEVSIHTQYKIPHLAQILRKRTLNNVIHPLDEEKLIQLAEARRQMVTARRLGSIDYEELKEKYERLKTEI